MELAENRESSSSASGDEEDRDTDNAHCQRYSRNLRRLPAPRDAQPNQLVPVHFRAHTRHKEVKLKRKTRERLQPFVAWFNAQAPEKEAFRAALDRQIEALQVVIDEAMKREECVWQVTCGYQVVLTIPADSPYYFSDAGARAQSRHLLLCAERELVEMRASRLAQQARLEALTLARPCDQYYENARVLSLEWFCCFLHWKHIVFAYRCLKWNSFHLRLDAHPDHLVDCMQCIFDTYLCLLFRHILVLEVHDLHNLLSASLPFGMHY